MKVHRDRWGLWVDAGGYVARPLHTETRFLEGDKVATYHFGGSVDAGVGKDKTCGRGEYLERWTTTGLFPSELKSRRLSCGNPLTDERIEEKLEFYRNLRSKAVLDKQRELAKRLKEWRAERNAQTSDREVTPPPRYDEVFQQGAKWLDTLAGGDDEQQ